MLRRPVEASHAEDIECRPMTAADTPDAVDIYASTAYKKPSVDALQRLAEILDHFQDHDPGGSWIATVAEAPAGFAVASRRGNLWVLPALFVDPACQASGLGRLLLGRALDYGDGTARGIITSSGDPRATRLYAAAGFTPHPTLYSLGRPDRTSIPSGLTAREASINDLVFMGSVDAEVRGATREDDLGLLLRQDARAWVLESRSGRGYAIARTGDPPIDGIPITVVATEIDTARSLLWQTLSEAAADTCIEALMPNRQWAFDVAFQAHLRFMPGGPFFTRGFDKPPSWITSGLFG